ncbi:hypothetical protein WJX84_011441 [Apatococcus fuscideae]|uniref:Uncharacterized protein n=1 Tax=Apatococcus fuscideae TaxID=2026836 RepID=A0AAW1SZQ1_9CHLO
MTCLPPVTSTWLTAAVLAGSRRAPLKRTLTISIASGRDQGVLQQAPEMLLTPGLLHEECAWARSKDAGTGRQEWPPYLLRAPSNSAEVAL